MTGRGGLVMRWTDKTADDRQLISSADLQSAIREAVKQFDPECKDFIDVIVEQRRPQSRLEANWAIKGVKFGRSDRHKAGQALSVIVARMQGEFALSAESARS
jgi:hypothetical protein